MPIQIADLTTRYPDLGTPLSQLGDRFFSGFSQARKLSQEAERQRLLDEATANGTPSLQQLATIGARTGDMGAALQALGLAEQGGMRDLQRQKLQFEMDQAKQTSAERARINQALGLGGAVAAPSGGAPAAAPAIGNPNEIQTRFLGAVKNAGLTNPYGLAAVAATGQRESGFSPGNMNRSWNDPSESGAPGQAGGIMSWRAERLTGLQNFARQRGEPGFGSPETQAQYLAQEDPTLIPRLNAARSPQEANQIMANAWRFAGYNRPGGELATRENLTTQFAGRFKGAGNQAAQPQSGVYVPPGVTAAQLRQEAQALAQSNPEAARQFMAQADALEQRSPSAPDGTPIAPANAQAGQQPQAATPQAPAQASRSTLPPDDPRPDLPNQTLFAIIGNSAASEPQRAAAKAILDRRQKWADEQRKIEQPTEAQRNYEAAKRGGFTGSFMDYQRAMREKEVSSGESEENKEMGRAAGKAAGEMLQAAAAAPANLSRLNRISTMMEQVATGKTTPARMSIAQWGRALGVNDEVMKGLGLDPRQAATGEALQAMINQLVVGQIGAGGFPANNFSDADRAFLVQTMPELSKDPRANAIVIEALRRAEQSKVDKAKSFREWKEANPKASYRDFEIEWAAQQANRSNFDDLRERADSLLQGGNPAMPPANKVGPQAAPTENLPTATNPQTGERIILRNGKWEPLR